MTFPRSKLWRRTPSGILLFDPDAVAGLGPFHLPPNHFLTHAAQLHDPAYASAGVDRPRSAEDKAEWDVRFHNIGDIDAQRDRAQLTWLDKAERLEVVCRCYLIVRGLLGQAAYWT